jgi:hypothetical protein
MNLNFWWYLVFLQIRAVDSGSAPWGPGTGECCRSCRVQFSKLYRAAVWWCWHTGLREDLDTGSGVSWAIVIHIPHEEFLIYICVLSVLVTLTINSVLVNICFVLYNSELPACWAGALPLEPHCSPFCFDYFGDRVLLFAQGQLGLQSSYFRLPAVVTVMTDTCHPA